MPLLKYTGSLDPGLFKNKRNQMEIILKFLFREFWPKTILVREKALFKKVHKKQPMNNINQLNNPHRADCPSFVMSVLQFSVLKQATQW